ncbi:competence/damage-inducible protein A [Neptunitalea lumnitzerae]|uniref:CinA-like protein n=1 Tax=Neptunitalea lumnitzerae TaxID=2965509 RepID=A0ABQ5MHU9_9FLAO|nr:competence/damage-inducible protein A [Neptunitalea sp. Y10]GLB48974.1 CinA-like protein [Neptunitalea sp. Y10]
MFAEIITIGDEILIGQIIDTNSAYIAKELNKIGVGVYQISSVQDTEAHILNALEEASSRVDIVIITGGLGPTKDDITKHTICKYFNDTLVQDDAVLAHVEELFAKYIKSTPISDLNRKQALVPSKATVLMNLFGTAPGMWIEDKGKIFISMPGVPFEMKGLVEREVLPRLQSKFTLPYIIHKTVLTAGLGESAIAEKLDAWEDTLPEFVKLAYLPNFGRVRLRFTAKGADKEVLELALNAKVKELHELIGDIIYGYEDDGDIEVLIGQLLKQEAATLATAESCTGGKIAELVTSVPGASEYFKGAVVSYATEVKEKVLGVPNEVIKAHSVVSAEVVELMALNVKELLATDYAIATTGNAGPEKGDSDAEIGTVFIALAGPKGVISKKFNFGKNRERVVNKAVLESFELLKNEIIKK